MAVNILNEWSDMRSGIDLNTERTPFSGGSGTLPAGGMGTSTTLGFGLVCAAIGLAIGFWFVPRIGAALVPIMILGAVCVLAYTDLLTRLGIGEIAAGFGLGAGPVLGTALVQDGSWSRAAIAASIPAFLMTFNLLLLNEFPDEDADRKGGRKNLVILLGRRPAALVYAVAAILTPLSIAVSVMIGWLPALALVGTLPSLLLFKPLQWAAGDTKRPVPIPALGANVGWNLGTNALIAVGLVAAVMIG
jgi:1,4-dihydroxy-2-naphthoate octaprenyltransferase